MKDKLFDIKSLLVFAAALTVGILYPSDVGMAWITSAIGAGLGVLSSIYGGAAAADEARKAQRELDRKEARDNAWYARRYNQRYLDTEAGQNLINTAISYNDKLRRRAEGGARVAGLSQSAVAKQKEQGTDMIGKTIAQIGANDTANKMQVDKMHREDQNTVTNQRIATHNQQAANITNAAAQASNALINAGAYLENDNDFWDGLTKNKNTNTNANILNANGGYGDTSLLT
jgi:hypothetical protein